MMDQIVAMIVDESKWLTISMSLAFVVMAIVLYLYRALNQSLRMRVFAAMNIFFSVMIGMMAFGHLLAVSTKLVIGTLTGSVVLFYFIGIILAAPSWLLIYHTWIRFSKGLDFNSRIIVFNIWLVISLISLGIHNLPLAIPGLFNIGYYFNSRPLIGWIIVSLAIAVSFGLFIGSLVFLASGQSFEQF